MANHENMRGGLHRGAGLCLCMQRSHSGPTMGHRFWDYKTKPVNEVLAVVARSRGEAAAEVTVTLGDSVLVEAGERSGGRQQLHLGAGSPVAFPDGGTLKPDVMGRQGTREAGRGKPSPGQAYIGRRHGGRGMADPFREEAVRGG